MRADALLAGADQVNGLQPFVHRAVALFEDCALADGELLAGLATLPQAEALVARQSFQADIRLQVPRSQCAEQLRVAGALDILVPEVPMPAGTTDTIHHDAAKRLRQAQAHLVAGN